MTKRYYTEKIHAKRVAKMLPKLMKRSCCPAALYYDPSRPCTEAWVNYPCPVCWTFLGNYKTTQCPCHEFGVQEAIHRTEQVLKEKGYDYEISR